MSTSAARQHAAGGVPAWTFADKVRKARTVSGFGQIEFAEKIGVTASSLAAYETGRSAPRFREAPTIAKSIQLLTGIPYTWFLMDDEPTTPETPTTDYGSEGSVIHVNFGARTA